MRSKIKEKDVVIQEIKQAIDTPDDIIFDYLQEKAFPNHPIGYAIAGDEKRVNSFTSKTLRDYISNNYAASNMVVCAVGNIEHKDLVEMAKKRLGDVKKETSFDKDIPFIWERGKAKAIPFPVVVI